LGTSQAISIIAQTKRFCDILDSFFPRLLHVGRVSWKKRRDASWVTETHGRRQSDGLAYCTVCDEIISLRNPRVGQRLFCPHCEMAVKVLSVNPLDLSWAYGLSYNDD
jgi:uncharacterized paraquat-inducible protein A